MVGCFFAWLLGNAVFSETAVKIFLIFCIKLGDYKGRKVTKPDFSKKIWFRDIREKVSKLAPNQTLWYLVGWLVGWLNGSLVSQFSQKRLHIFFLIFGMKLGDCEGRRVTKLAFSKKFMIWRYWRRGLQISPKSDTFIFSSKTALTNFFLAFGLTLVLNMTFNLNENYFSQKFAIWRYLTWKSSRLPKLRFLAIFWTLYH